MIDGVQFGLEQSDLILLVKNQSHTHGCESSEDSVLLPVSEQRGESRVTWTETFHWISLCC